jgi:hypothetical protein
MGYIEKQIVRMVTSQPAEQRNGRGRRKETAEVSNWNGMS